MLRRLVLALASLALVGALLVWGPEICPVQNMFGVPCPGCGLTRASLELMHGHLAAALRYHPLVLPMLPVFLVMLFEEVWRKVVGWRLSLLARVPNLVWVPLGVAVAGVWIARFFGAFGGPVDPIDPARSWFVIAWHWIAG